MFEFLTKTKEQNARLRKDEVYLLQKELTPLIQAIRVVDADIDIVVQKRGSVIYRVLSDGTLVPYEKTSFLDNNEGVF